MSTEPESELPSHWTDNRRRQWTCRLDVPMVYDYCGREDLSLLPRPGGRTFSVDDLNDRQLFDLAFLGTRWNARAQGDKTDPEDPSGEETRPEFLKAHAEGSAYEDALFAARAAVQNFTLRLRIPNAGKAAVAAKLRKYEDALRAAFRTWMTTASAGEETGSPSSPTLPDAADSPPSPIPVSTE